jgi:glyoxylase-like metal-dependent hydrolase (beta-lactamase superfamily II)
MSENRGKFTRDAAQSYLAHEPEMQVDKWTVSDGTCRTIFIEAQNSVIAFDTFGTPGRARAYSKAISQCIPGKPVKTVIYSHDHLDHCGFASDLAPDAEIIADEICAKVIKLRQAEGQSQVTRVLSGPEKKMNIDGCEFTLLNPGPTHGSGNISAWFAKDKILFSSDTILANAKYGFVPDYHLFNFVKFMRGFLELEWDVFVPGRYALTDRAGFEKGCDYIEAVQLESQNAFAQFVPIWAYEPMKAYVLNKLSERFGDLEGFEEHVGLTALRIVHHYLMGGWGLEDTPEPSVMLADQVEL